MHHFSEEYDKFSSYATKAAGAKVRDQMVQKMKARSCSWIPSTSSGPTRVSTNSCSIPTVESWAVRQIVDRAYPIDYAEGHGATLSVYLRAPNSNGIELYCDRPRSEWLDSQGKPVLKADAFYPADLLAGQDIPV
jgi:hypothetical protein